MHQFSEQPFKVELFQLLFLNEAQHSRDSICVWGFDTACQKEKLMRPAPLSLWHKTYLRYEIEFNVLEGYFKNMI